MPTKWFFFFSLRTHQTLTAAGIPCTVILDSAVAYAMGKVDLVIVGSEAVVESGGIINAVGSYQIALIAKAANVPVYALAERSFALSLSLSPSLPHLILHLIVTNFFGCSHYHKTNCPRTTIKSFHSILRRAPLASQPMPFR